MPFLHSPGSPGWPAGLGRFLAWEDPTGNGSEKQTWRLRQSALDQDRGLAAHSADMTLTCTVSADSTGNSGGGMRTAWTTVTAALPELLPAASS